MITMTPRSGLLKRRPRHPRGSLLLATAARVTAAALAAAALSLLLADASAARTGVRIISPADEAVVPAGPLPVRLAVRNVRGLRVTVDQHDLTGRLRAAGRRRIAVLRGRRVTLGPHWLVVRWRPAGQRKARTIARRFMVARRDRPLAVKLSPRRRVLYAAGVVKLQLRLKRGVGLIRARVNGHRVRVPHLGRLWPTTTLRLGARHHLRFGRNRVQVLVHDFRHARYDRETWTVVVRRTRPLAAGFAAYRGEAGGRAVRLDGRGARPTRPGRRLSWRWRILRKPRGSRAKMVRGSSATPRLPIDVRGRYTLRERVTERPAGRHRGGGGGTRTTSHLVSVMGDTNAPPLGASLQVELPKYPPPFGSGSITIDDAPSAGLPEQYDCDAHPPPGPSRCVYPMPDADQAAYLLVLDAVTLETKTFSEFSGCAIDDRLRSAIQTPWGGKNVIAILTSGQSCGGTPSSLIDNSHSYTYIFTPSTKPDLGIRSGWYSEAPTDDVPGRADVGRAAEISGFLQKSWPVGNTTEPSEQYQFVPGNYIAYDTSRANAPAGQNTMVVGDEAYPSPLPGGATDGFQVLVLDKTLKPMLGTPTAFTNGGPVADMARLLEQARATRGVSTVFVQSIGTPTPSAGSADAWNAAAVQLENLGANTDVFLSLGDGGGSRPPGATGWYSFVAAPDPGCLPSSPTPCESASEASAPLTKKSGDLSGVLGRNQTWQYAPLIDEPGGDEHTGEMLTLAYRPPSKWPFSDDPDARHVLNYLATYNVGATDLRPLGDPACYDPGKLKDARSSYCNIEIPGSGWSTLHSDLGDSNTGRGVCARYPGQDVVGVDQDKYEAVCDQVSRETGQLSDVQDDMLKMKNEMGTEQALTAYLAVKDLSNSVKSSVEAGGARASRDVTAEGLEIAGEFVELISLFLPPPFQEGGEVFGATLSLAGEITSLAEGDEQGESALGEPVTVDPAELGSEMQQRVNAAGAAFDHAWDMLVSDPEKLNAAYENFALDPSAPGCEEPGKTCGIWTKVPDDLVRSKPPMQNAVRHWAAGKFMAATYDVWMVDTSQQRGVGPSDVHTIGCDRVEVAYVPLVSSHHFETWAPFYGMPQEAAYYLRDRVGLTYPDGSPRHGSNIVVLAQGDVSAKPSQTSYGHYEDLPRRYWPPASLMNDLYAPLNIAGVGGGYGWERPWLYSRGQRFVWHGPGWMLQPPIPYTGGRSRCYWFAPDRVPG